jgi:hypothetical protein
MVLTQLMAAVHTRVYWYLMVTILALVLVTDIAPIMMVGATVLLTLLMATVLELIVLTEATVVLVLVADIEPK